MSAKPAPPRPVPRLYLATPRVDDPAALLASLPAMLAVADVAAVLLRLAESDPRTMLARIKALAPVVQAGGAALLLDGHVVAIDDEDDDAARLGDVVRADVRQARVRGRVEGAYGDQLEGVDRARLAVDREDEVVGGQPGQRASVLVDDDRVDGDQIDACPEYGLLLRQPRRGGSKHEHDGEDCAPHDRLMRPL